MLSVTRQTISNWECGQGAPSLDKAAELAAIYKVSLDDLAGNEVVIAAGEKKGKDLHILKKVKSGKTCRSFPDCRTDAGGDRGMTIFLLIVIIGLLIYIICEYKKENRKVDTKISWEKLLPGYVGKNCEIVIKEPLVNIDVMYSVKGIMTDVDDEWLEMECTVKKKKVLKIFRIANVNGIKEIV